MKDKYIINVLNFTQSYEVSHEEKFEVGEPKDVKNLLNDLYSLGKLTREHFVMIGLDTQNFVTCVYTVHIGSLSASMVAIRESFFTAVQNNCASVIFAHNHPSQSVPVKPSREDIRVSNRLMVCGVLIGIDVLDSIIVSENNYYSMAENDDIQINQELIERIQTM